MSFSSLRSFLISGYLDGWEGGGEEGRREVGRAWMKGAREVERGCVVYEFRKEWRDEGGRWEGRKDVGKMEGGKKGGMIGAREEGRRRVVCIGGERKKARTGGRKRVGKGD